MNRNVRKQLDALLSKRILVLDGAMGTMLQQCDLTAADFGGPALEGCNENLVLTRPAGVETRVSLNGGASNLTVDGNHFNGFAREGQAFVSPGYATATDRVDIGISSGASDVTVRS